MKLIIAGSRNLDIGHDVIYALLEDYGIYDDDMEVVSGGAKGIDACGEFFAELFNNPIKVFPADWDKYGKSAGPIRNKEMAEYADALLLIWDGESRGSANMKKCMEELGKPIYEVILRTINCKN